MGTESLTDLERRIIADLSAGNFRLSVHAVERCRERQIARADIQTAAQRWLDCWTDKDDCVHVAGPDWAGEEIEIRAVDDGGTIVVTIIGA